MRIGFGGFQVVGEMVVPQVDDSLLDEELTEIMKRLEVFWALGGGKKPCPKCGDEK